MSPLTSTQTHVFAGEMKLGEELIDIALEFQGDSVRLRHADTVIGSWPRTETDVVRISSDHYRVTAEGESISFHPYTASEFAQFLSGDEPGSAAPVGDLGGAAAPGLQTDTRLMAPGNGMLPTSDQPEWHDVPLWEALEEGTADADPPPQGAEETEAFSPGSVHGPNPARPVYPPTPTEPVQFSSPAPPTSAADHTAHHPWQQGPGRTASQPAPPSPPPAELEAPTTTPPTASPAPSTENGPATPAVEPEPTEPAAVEAGPTNTETAPRTGPQTILGGPDLDASQESVVTPPADAAEIDPDPIAALDTPPSSPIEDDSIPGTASALLDRIRGRINSLRSAPADSPSPPAGETMPTDEDGPATFDDAENLRQWAMVSVVGLAVVGLLVALVWGALSLFGGSDDTPTATTTISATTSIVANAIDRTPATVTPPVVASPDTIVAQDQPSFIEQWNKLATAYAYNLAIDADSEPVSTDVTSNIHLSFDADRVLTLDMTPVGNGSDRDILVAMGMAVAWAEPDLDPAARKDLLGSLGIDIDSPKLADIGGELTRPGHTYRASVIDGIIRFQVSPPS